jgi:transcriptional regulator with XRE-family HTH domain
MSTEDGYDRWAGARSSLPAVSVRTIAQWERGEREPGWFNVIALAEALRVDCRAFLAEPATAPERCSPGRPAKKRRQERPDVGESRPRGKGKQE